MEFCQCLSCVAAKVAKKQFVTHFKWMHEFKHAWHNYCRSTRENCYAFPPLFFGTAFCACVCAVLEFGDDDDDATAFVAATASIATAAASVVMGFPCGSGSWSLFGRCVGGVIDVMCCF